MAYGGASAKVLASIEYYLEDHAPKMLDLFRAFGITARLSHNYGVGVLVPSDGGVSLTAEHEKATTNKEGCALKVKLLDLVLPASVTPAVLDELAAGGKIVTAAAREHKITGKNGAWTIGGAAVTPASVTIIHCGRNGESSDPVSFVYNINKPSLPDGTPTDKTLKGILSPPMGADKKRKGALEIEGGGGDGAIMSEILTHVVGDKSAAVKKLQLLLYAGLSAISPPDQQTPPALGQIALLVVPETDDAVDLFTALVGLAHFDRWGASGVVKEEVFAFRNAVTAAMNDKNYSTGHAAGAEQCLKQFRKQRSNKVLGDPDTFANLVAAREALIATVTGTETSADKLAAIRAGYVEFVSGSMDEKKVSSDAFSTTIVEPTLGATAEFLIWNLMFSREVGRMFGEWCKGWPKDTQNPAVNKLNNAPYSLDSTENVTQQPWGPQLSASADDGSMTARIEDVTEHLLNFYLVEPEVGGGGDEPPPAYLVSGAAEWVAAGGSIDTLVAAVKTATGSAPSADGQSSDGANSSGAYELEE